VKQISIAQEWNIIFETAKRG